MKTQKKVLDIDFVYNKKNNLCDIREVLVCIQAWHEMLNPGHHHIELHADGSGKVISAANYPPMFSIPLNERNSLLTFVSLQDFINKTRIALEEDGFEIIDSDKKRKRKLGKFLKPV